MHPSIASSIKTLAVSLGFLALFCLGHGVAKADTVTFTNTGTFTNAGASAGNNTSSITIGTGANQTTLTFTDGSNSVVSPPEANVNFGTITIATTGAGASLDGTTLTLNITQTSPTIGGGAFTGQITGTIFLVPSPGGSNAMLVFSSPNNTFVIGNVRYTIDGSFRLPAPGTGNTLTLQGTVNAVPEPATMMLLGTGLAGLAGAVRRRRHHA